MEIKQTFSDAVLLETLQITAHKATQSRLFMRQVLNQIELAPVIVLKRHVELRVHCVHFPLRLRIAQQWAQEELSEAIESLAKGIIGHLEMVIGVRERGKRIVISAIVSDKFGVFVLRGILLSTHEEHMLEEVGRTIEWFGVERRSNVHIERSGAFVGLVVLNQETAHLIAELNALVEAFVALRRDDF